MSAAWPFGPTVQRVELGPLATPISTGDGESLSVSPIERHPSWLAKLYRPDAGLDSARLDRLIALPHGVTAADQNLFRAATSWPVSRIVENGTTVGVVVPLAPPKFTAALQLPAGGDPVVGPLRIDWLVYPSQEIASRGLGSPSVHDRLAVCRNLVAVAALIERHGLVYADWSYVNAFWSKDNSVYVIDTDACSFGARQRVTCPQWDEPDDQESLREVDAYSDRFRVGLMVARCLTGQRHQLAALHEVAGISAAAGVPGLGPVVRQLMTAAPRERRDSIESLLAALSPSAETRAHRQMGNGSGVVGWEDVTSPHPCNPDVTQKLAPPQPNAGAAASAAHPQTGVNAHRRGQVPAPGSRPRTQTPKRTGPPGHRPGTRTGTRAVRGQAQTPPRVRPQSSGTGGLMVILLLIVIAAMVVAYLSASL